MQIETIHCFLTHPAKHMDEKPTIGGTAVAKSGKLYSMLKDIYENAGSECHIDISFDRNADGEQQNDCRDLILAYINQFRIEAGREIALRLQSVTNEKSGLGLLFLMSGQDGNQVTLVISRFPADHGILAEENKNKLSVEFLEKVFMKSAKAYKSVLYQDKPGPSAFWVGRAVDKQINNGAENIANYWIRDFLLSDLKTTSAAGTRRLALALKTAINQVPDAQAKSEIAAAVTLIGSVAGQTLTTEDFCKHFGFSKESLEAVRNAIKHPSLMVEGFKIDTREFHQHIAFRSVKLDNGGVLTAESDKFDDVFDQEVVDDEVKFTTQGQIIDQRLRKGRI